MCSLALSCSDMYWYIICLASIARRRICLRHHHFTVLVLYKYCTNEWSYATRRTKMPRVTGCMGTSLLVSLLRSCLPDEMSCIATAGGRTVEDDPSDLSSLERTTR